MSLTLGGGPLTRRRPPQVNYAIVWNAMVAASVQPSDTTAIFPYRGASTYWSTPGLPDAAWAYAEPLTDAAAMAGHVCYSHDELSIDAREEIGG